MALNVKKGDNVLVIAGKDKGKSGKVLTAIPSDNAVVVAGVNIIHKHKKPKNAQDKGGIMKAEGKIDASNVQIICPTCGKATRVANTVNGDKKVRTCKKCGANLDKAVKKESKKASTKATEAKAEAKTTKSATKAAPKATKASKPANKTVKKPATKTATKSVARKSQAKGQ